MALLTLISAIILKSARGFTREGIDLARGQRVQGSLAVALGIASVLVVVGLVALVVASTRLFPFESGPGALQWFVGCSMGAVGLCSIAMGVRLRRADLFFCGVILVGMGIAFIHPPYLAGSRINE